MKRKELKIVRIKADLSQAQVAEGIGISSSRYSRFENGQCDLNLNHTKSLLKFLKINISIL